MAKAPRPEVTTLTGAQLEQLLAEVRPLVPAATYQLLEGLLRTLQWIMAAFEQKTISIARLKQMLFGHSTETTAQVFPPQPGTDPASDQAPVEPKAKRKGHGRNGSKDYPGAKRVPIPHPTLKVGQLCPQCLRAKLYLLKTPARLMRIVAQPLFQATLYELERLRCAPGAVRSSRRPPRRKPAPVSMIPASAPCWRSCAMAPASPCIGWTSGKRISGFPCRPPRNGN